ncbi:superoxide dismutase Cu-Zn-like protein [Euroglyphus maynei]|uniref:Superoxide dismutase Cu-Zn-like protein n=1 Tax=Euroglyphus maynei TaxID=6958 RepID=A0A1Y3B7U6_EURMA|nr:superoxide dismutase Cu-Zn-like protein [Euroglyphus maynei]
MITATAMTIDSTFSDDQQNNDESNNTESILKKLLTNLSTLNNRLIRIEKIVNDLQQCHRNDQQHHQEISSMMNNQTLMANCHMRPNRHIALLNQQDINGEIQLKQISTNPIPIISMKIRLQGFKVGCDPNLNITDCNTETTTTETLNNNESTNERTAFGMHIHEGSDLSYDCQSVGNHYNPFNMTHGAPNDTNRHLGDLGNIYADQNGFVHMDNLQFYDLSLDQHDSDHYIVNRTIVVCEVFHFLKKKFNFMNFFNQIDP